MTDTQGLLYRVGVDDARWAADVHEEYSRIRTGVEEHFRIIFVDVHFPCGQKAAVRGWIHMLFNFAAPVEVCMVPYVQQAWYPRNKFI